MTNRYQRALTALTAHLAQYPGLRFGRIERAVSGTGVDLNCTTRRDDVPNLVAWAQTLTETTIHTTRLPSLVLVTVTGRIADPDTRKAPRPRALASRAAAPDPIVVNVHASVPALRDVTPLPPYLDLPALRALAEQPQQDDPASRHEIANPPANTAFALAEQLADADLTWCERSGDRPRDPAYLLHLATTVTALPDRPATPSDAASEAAAIAYAESVGVLDETASWASLTPDAREHYRRQARAVLAAAVSAEEDR